MDNNKNIVVMIFSLLFVTYVSASDKNLLALSDGISAPSGEGRLGMHMPSNSLSFSRSMTPPSKTKNSKTAQDPLQKKGNLHTQSETDSKINEESFGRYINELQNQENGITKIGYLLGGNLYKSTLCLLLPAITQWATTRLDGDDTISLDKRNNLVNKLTHDENVAIARAYLMLALSATANDPRGRPGPHYMLSKNLNVRLKTKFIKPHKLHVMRTLVKANTVVVAKKSTKKSNTQIDKVEKIVF